MKVLAGKSIVGYSPESRRWLRLGDAMKIIKDVKFWVVLVFPDGADVKCDGRGRLLVE